MRLSGEIRRALAGLVVVVAASACAGLPPCPERGGPPWLALASDHFVVRTDMDSDDARRLVGDLEDTRAAMLAMVWPGQEGPPGKIVVIALRSSNEMREFGDIAGMFVRRPPFPPTVVIGGTTRLTTLKHEVAHLLSRWVLPNQPDWFSEGLATFLETIYYDRDERKAYAGRSGDDHFRVVRQGWFLSLEELQLGVPTEDIFRRSRYYASSWLVVHYMLNRRGEAFADFQRRLGRFEEPRAAWSRSFPDVDGSALRNELLGYLRDDRFTIFMKSLSPWTGSIAVRPLPDAEVHAARAFLFAHTGWSEDDRQRRRPRAEAEVAEALRLDRGAPEALAVRRYALEVAGGRGARDVEDARTASTAHPDSWLSWLMVADAAPEGDPSVVQEALTRALALAPDEGAVVARMAILRANQSRWADALLFSDKALRLNVLNEAVMVVHLAALVEVGRCDEALAWGHQAARLVTGRAHGQVERLTARCQAPSPPVPAAVPVSPQ
jgi:hypothetical protein